MYTSMKALVLAALAVAASSTSVQAAQCTANTKPGTVCTGTVNGVSRQCVQPVQPTATSCQGSLLAFLDNVVNVASVPASSTCAAVPCCDEDTTTGTQPTECVTAQVGCIADVKLCVGGAVGELLDELLPNLDIDLGGGPITNP